jgi:uncharacterized protein YndB with AHSA1/START domain
MTTHRSIRGPAARATAIAAPLFAVSLAVAEVPSLVHEGVIAAPVEKVWAAYTTSDGLQSWMAPHAEIDVRIGGKMRTNYNKDGVLGDAGTIENTILAYEPLRMLSIKVAHAPEKFPFKHAIENMWTVLYFEPLAPDRTRLRCVSMGFTDDDESRQMRAFFDRGNAYTLRKLQEFFGMPTTRPAADALNLARRVLGGEWRHESQRDDGGILRAKQIFTDGPDGKSIIGEGWLDTGKGPFCHSRLQVYREPGTGRLVFQNINESGAIARGELRAIGPDKLEWDWNAQELDGATANYRVHMTFTGSDRCRFALSRLENAEWKQLFELPFHREAPAPADRKAAPVAPDVEHR